MKKKEKKLIEEINKSVKLVTKKVINSQNRFKSPVLWSSIASVIYMISRYWFNFDIPNWADISTQMIAILSISFGIVNNPINKTGF
jgi:uncharacterized membrane protein